MVTLEMAMNVSSGILSAASKSIKKTNYMTDVEFGYFGLAQGIGRTIGSILYTATVNILSARILGGAFTVVKAFVMVSFEFTANKWVLIGLRGVVGFVHMPPSTYIPIWIDQYSFRKYKTVQMSFLQALVPFGKVLGFILVNFFGPDNWKRGYDVEAVYLMICGLFIVFSPSRYFNRKVVMLPEEDRSSELNKGQYEGVSIFNERQSVKGVSKTKQLWDDLTAVICSAEFEVCNCAKALQNGTQSCIHFWCGDFMVNRLGIDGTKKTVIYTWMNVCGPLFGFFLSPIISRKFGSYETVHAPYVIFVLHFITASFGFTATLINNQYVFIGSMTMFFGLLSLCLAMTNGCLMLSVNQKLKGMCYSVGNITCMSITGALSPVIYGFFNDMFNPRGIKFAGMLSVMSINASASIFLLILGGMKRRKAAKKAAEEKGEELVEKEEV